MNGARWSEDAADEDDRALVLRARHDRAAFALLYRRYVVSVYRYCAVRLTSHEAAEDATADIFARALAGLGDYGGDRPFRSWLFAIAHNTVANVHRTRSRRPLVPLTEADRIAAGAPSPEEQAMAREAGENVRALLARLPVGQREVVELRLAGLTGSEVATALGRSPGSVKIAQLRAYSRLRDLLTGRVASERPATKDANLTEEVPTRER